MVENNWVLVRATKWQERKYGGLADRRIFALVVFINFAIFPLKLGGLIDTKSTGLFLRTRGCPRPSIFYKAMA